MNVHLKSHEAHVLWTSVSLRCTGQMHGRPCTHWMNVHTVLHLHGISGTM